MHCINILGQMSKKCEVLKRILPLYVGVWGGILYRMNRKELPGKLGFVLVSNLWEADNRIGPV